MAPKFKMLLSNSNLNFRAKNPSEAPPQAGLIFLNTYACRVNGEISPNRGGASEGGFGAKIQTTITALKNALIVI